MGTHQSNMVRIRIVSADISSVIQKISESGISLYELQIQDELTAHFSVSYANYKNVAHFLNCWGVTWKLLVQQKDLLSSIVNKGRIVMVAGLLFICLLSIILSRRILFVQVEGNQTIPARKITEAAADCGVRFWAKSRTIRSESVKNKLLDEIPELRWAGVNTTGCVAVIRVEEKDISLKPSESHDYITSIVASEDGVIDSITVTSGNPTCRVGQAVKAGQTLISGYVDCGLVVKAQQASGEVFARTKHYLTVISPQKWTRRSTIGEKDVKYSLKIGKKLINFNKGSGISPVTCVKMYEERYVKLPGGFTLPVSWIKRSSISYETEVSRITPTQSFLEQEAEKYQLSQLVAGQVLHSDVDYSSREEYSVLSCKYLCSEMIGRTKIEQSVQGETNCD